MKIDIESFLEAYKTLEDYKAKYDKIQEKLKNLTLKGTTKFSVIMAAKENYIQTKPDDPAYNLELEAFDLRRIIEISMYVLDNQMEAFKKNMFIKYQNYIVKFRKRMVNKGMKSVEVWENIQNLILKKNK